MELIIFNRLNVTTSRNIQRTINVSSYGGIFYFSKTVVEEYEFKAGDKLLIAQQKDNPKIWFFIKAEQSDETAFELKDDAGRMVFRCAGLARAILSKFGNVKSLNFLVEKESTVIDEKEYVKLIPIIPNQGGVKKLVNR